MTTAPAFATLVGSNQTRSETMFAGKCPKCGDTVNRCDLAKIDIGNRGIGPFVRAISASCPACGTILGVTIDPAALAADLAEELGKVLGRRTR
jgi:predicted RNA-binding Zn-ribbon protein involved in translation (DUF1610 family)